MVLKPSQRKHVAAAALALAVSACASPAKDPDKEDLETSGDDAGDGDLSKPAKTPATTKGDASKGKGKDSSDGDKQSSDDGYDDDWNNMGSEQAKKTKKNNSNQNAGDNQQDADEPPIQNDKKNEAPAEPVAEAPPANPVPEQTPASEPPADLEPAPLAAAPTPPAAPAAPLPAGVRPVISGAPLIRQDLKPVSAELVWVGFDYLEKDSVVKVELVTRGTPKFNIFQEHNKSGQPELIVRFFQTKLRSKVRRDIDASEFRSPVAFVRMRYDEDENAVDVVMTMRDPVQPRMFAKGGNVLLTFPVPDHYFGNSLIGGAPVAHAEVLANSNVMPDFDGASDISEGMKIARAFVNNPGGDAFKGAPADGGKPVNAAPAPASEPAASAGNALPADFSNAPASPAPVDTAANMPPANNGAITDAGVDDFNFGGNAVDGEPAPGGEGNNVDAEGADNNDSSNNNDQSSDDDDDEGDSIEDGDTGGDGDSSQEIDKFDVRAKRGTGGWRVTLDRMIFDTPTAAALYLSALPAFGSGPAAVAAFTPAPSRLLAALDHPWTARAVRSALIAAAAAVAPQALAKADRPFSIAGVAQDEDGLDDGGGGNNNAGNNNGGNGNAKNANGNAAPAANNTFSGNNAGGNPFANAGANAAPPVNTPTANAANTTAFGNTGANAAAAASAAPAVANAAPAPVVDAAGAGNGEPPVAASVDLSGQESQGNDNADAPQPSAGGRPIKLDFRGARLAEVVRALGEESGVNFVLAPAPEVTNAIVNINFNNVPFNDALKALLEANGLGMVEAGPNIVRIDSLANLAKDKADLEARRKAEIRLRPTKVLVQRLNYASADAASTMLGAMLKGAGTEDNRISVQVDKRTNSVIVNAPPNDLSMVKALLERIDLETPQVKISTRIVEVLKKFGNDFGISWGGPFNYDQSRGLGFGNLNFPNYARSRFAIDPGGPDKPDINMGFNFGSINKLVDLDLALKMAEARSTVEVIQSGDLVVEDQFAAIIKAGSTDLFRKTSAAVAPAAGGGAAGANNTNFDPVEYLLTMEVTPQVTASGAVTMDIKVSNTSPAPAVAQGTGVAAATYNREVHTKLLRQSGETAAVGGIFTSDKSRVNNGVPFLSALPIIGALFRHTSQSDTKRELLVMLTPVILHGGKASGGGGEASGGDADDGNVGNNASNSGNVALNDNGGNNNSGGGNNANFGNANQVSGGNQGNQAVGNNNGGDDDDASNSPGGNNNAGSGSDNAGGDDGGEE